MPSYEKINSYSDIPDIPPEKVMCEELTDEEEGEYNDYYSGYADVAMGFDADTAINVLASVHDTVIGFENIIEMFKDFIKCNKFEGTSARDICSILQEIEENYGATQDFYNELCDNMSDYIPLDFPREIVGG